MIRYFRTTQPQNGKWYLYAENCDEVGYSAKQWVQLERNEAAGYLHVGWTFFYDTHYQMYLNDKQEDHKPMKVIEEGNKYVSEISQLSAGECFRYKDKVYMRISHVKTISGEVEAVTLGLGQYGRYGGDTLVERVNVEAHVKAVTQ